MFVGLFTEYTLLHSSVIVSACRHKPNKHILQNYTYVSVAINRKLKAKKIYIKWKIRKLSIVSLQDESKK